MADSPAVVHHQPAPPQQPRAAAPDEAADATSIVPTTAAGAEAPANNAHYCPRPPKGGTNHVAATYAPQRAPAPRSIHRTCPGLNPGIGAALPAGGASAAAALLHNPQALHDVEFYQAIAQELPTCAVVQSILYTHRSVTDDAPTCDEALAAVEQSVRSWRRAQEEHMAAVNAREGEAAQRALAEAAEQAEQKEAEYQRIMARLDRSLAEMEGRIDRTLSDESDAILHSREAMAQRIREREERARATCVSIAEVSENRVAAQRELDMATAFAKLGINETLERGLLLSDEERARIQLRFQAANSKQRASIMDECLESSEQLVAAEEARARAYLQQWLASLNQRVHRLLRAQTMVASLLTHTATSESGLRSNNALEEEREFEAIVSTFQLGPSAVDAIAAIFRTVRGAGGGLHPALFEPEGAMAGEGADSNRLGSAAGDASASESFAEPVIEAFFRSFLRDSEESERFALFVASRLRTAQLDHVASNGTLRSEEEQQRSEILKWMEAQRDRLLRQHRAQAIIAELVDHPVTRERSERIATSLDEQRAREYIYTAFRGFESMAQSC